MKHGWADGRNRIAEFIEANVAAMFRDGIKVGTALRTVPKWSEFDAAGAVSSRSTSCRARLLYATASRRLVRRCPVRCRSWR